MILREIGRDEMDRWPTIAEASDTWLWIQLRRRGAHGDLATFLESRRSHSRCHHCGRTPDFLRDLPMPYEVIMVRDGLCSTCQANRRA